MSAPDTREARERVVRRPRKEHACCLCGGVLPRGVAHKALNVLPGSWLGRELGVDKPTTLRRHIAFCPSDSESDTSGGGA